MIRGNTNANKGRGASGTISTEETQTQADEIRKLERMESQQHCDVCLRYPYRSNDMIMPMMAAEQEGLDLDAGIFEYIYNRNAQELAFSNLEDDSARVDEETARRTMERCARHIRRLQSELHKNGILQTKHQRFVVSGSKNSSSQGARVVAPLDFSELQLGALLGNGGFSSVYEVSAIRATEKWDQKVSKHEKEARKYLATHAQTHVSDFAEGKKGQKVTKGSKVKGGKAKGSSSGGSISNDQERSVSKYAIKFLRRGLTSEPDRFERAAIDLVLEAQLLLGMDHPNIVGMRGWGVQGVDGFRSGHHTAFFIVMDRLPERLEDRIFHWRETTRKYRNRIKLPWGKSKNSLKLDQTLIERLEVAHSMAEAVKYMHDRRIINRDIKTTNVGFDIDGELKLFDFGLSRLLPTRKEHEEDSYLMSRVGTKYYMAPEIRRKIPYNLSADCYSYGVCLWELLSLGSPREALKKFKDDGPNRSARCPLPICNCWPKELSAIVKACLHYAPIHRPCIDEILVHLESILFSLGHRPARPYAAQRRSTLRVDVDALGSLVPGGNSNSTSLRDGPKTQEDTQAHTVSADLNMLDLELISVDNCKSRLNSLDPGDTDGHEESQVEDTPGKVLPTPADFVSRLPNHSFHSSTNTTSTTTKNSTETTKQESELAELNMIEE